MSKLAHGASCKPMCIEGFRGTQTGYTCTDGVLNDFQCLYKGRDCEGTVLEISGTEFACGHLRFLTGLYCNDTLAKRGASAPSGASYSNQVLFGQLCPITLRGKCWRNPNPICENSDLAQGADAGTIVGILFLCIFLIAGVAAMIHFKKVPYIHICKPIKVSAENTNTNAAAKTSTQNTNVKDEL